MAPTGMGGVGGDAEGDGSDGDRGGTTGAGRAELVGAGDAADGGADGDAAFGLGALGEVGGDAACGGGAAPFPVGAGAAPCPVGAGPPSVGATPPGGAAPPPVGTDPCVGAPPVERLGAAVVRNGGAGIGCEPRGATGVRVDVGVLAVLVDGTARSADDVVESRMQLTNNAKITATINRITKIRVLLVPPCAMRKR